MVGTGSNQNIEIAVVDIFIRLRHFGDRVFQQIADRFAADIRVLGTVGVRLIERSATGTVVQLNCLQKQGIRGIWKQSGFDTGQVVFEIEIWFTPRSGKIIDFAISGEIRPYSQASKQATRASGA